MISTLLGLHVPSSSPAGKRVKYDYYHISTNAGVDRSLRISVNMVTKALLQYLMLLAPDPDFPELWARILQVLQVRFQHPSSCQEKLGRSFSLFGENTMVKMQHQAIN